MKKTVEFDVKKYNENEIKKILWRLCYEPENILKEIELEDTDPKEAREAILSKCKEAEITLNFGDENPALDTLGIDLGIKNTVVRDVLLQKVYEAIDSNFYNIPKAVTLLTTDYLESIKESKVIGGLKILGFLNVEANYLYNSCNLYPVGLLLKKIMDKSNEKISTTVPARSQVVRRVVEVEEKKVKKSSTNRAAVLVSNKETIEDVFSLLKDEKDLAQIRADLEAAKKEVERLQKLESLISILSSNGISLEEIIDKKQKLLELFSAMAAL